MTNLIKTFKSGQDVVFPITDLEQFRAEVHKLPELYEYRILYDGDEVMIKRIL